MEYGCQAGKTAVSRGEQGCSSICQSVATVMMMGEQIQHTGISLQPHNWSLLNNNEEKSSILGQGDKASCLCVGRAALLTA